MMVSSNKRETPSNEIDSPDCVVKERLPLAADFKFMRFFTV